MNLLRSLWNYRHFVMSSIRNDVITRFSRSKLGGTWALLNPLAQVLIYALIFANIISAKLPNSQNKYAYVTYLMAGLLAWTLFTEIVSRCLTVFIDYGNLLKKVQFPRITLPAITMGSCLVNNMLLFLSMATIFIIIGHGITWKILLIIPITLILAFFAVGLGLILGVFNIFLRDIGQIVPVVLQVWFWFTPIVYPINIVPETYRHYLEYNPLFHFTYAYQQILLYNKIPSFIAIGAVSIIAIILLIFGLVLFRRSQEDMVDAL